MQARIRLLQKACEQDHDNVLQFCGMYEGEGRVACEVSSDKKNGWLNLVKIEMMLSYFSQIHETFSVVQIPLQAVLQRGFETICYSFRSWNYS